MFVQASLAVAWLYIRWFIYTWQDFRISVIRSVLSLQAPFLCHFYSLSISTLFLQTLKTLAPVQSKPHIFATLLIKYTVLK
jgi:hypothetical protein